MTANKRFEMNVGVLNFTDNQTKRMYSEYNLEEIVDLLNAQHEEIERLRKENNELEKFRYAVFKNLHTITEKGDMNDL